MRFRRVPHARQATASLPGDGQAAPAEIVIGEAELRELSTVFAPGPWLEDLGRTAWLIVGVFGLLAGLVWLAGATLTITGPVVVGTVVATVAMPAVGALSRRRVPRAAGAVLVLLSIIAIAGVVVMLVIGGITSQHDSISEQASNGADHLASWVQSLGVSKSGADGAKSSVSQAAPQAIATLTKGIINGIAGIASVAFGLSLTALALFFLLKDGPTLRHWVDGHLGVPRPVAETITGGVIRSLRGYFRGVTLVAAFNGIVVWIGALILGVPLAGTIAVVTFIAAYVPFIGAFVAGAFAVVLTLGANGTTDALIMLAIVILANGLLQNLVQPFAMGAALDLHPLVVLIVTIGSGCVFGTLGLILAAPLTSAAVHINRQLTRARARALLESAAEEVAEASGPPASSPA
jgi:predicted PurR-regulated permease PerM